MTTSNTSFELVVYDPTYMGMAPMTRARFTRLY